MVRANIDLPGVNATGNQNTTGNAATATILATARTIGGVSFDGSANIDLPGVNATGNQNTTGSAATLTTARNIGGVSFDGSANIDLPGVNATGNQNTTGNAATATILATARTIGGVSFDGSANIDLPGVNATGNQNTTGSAATLTTARNIGGVSFDGSANIDLPGVNATGNQNTTGNAATATILATARTIGGVSFDGSANIDLPGVNATGNQNTTGSAATLTTARNIGGVSFDGSANIDLPGVNATGNQNTTGNAATATILATARTIAGVSFDGSSNINLSLNGFSDVLANTTNFSNSILLGQSSTGTLSSADYNVGVGYGVFSSLTSGTGNMANGYNALNSLTGGTGNVAIGRQVLSKITTGSKNVGIGRQAGIQIVGGSVGGTSLVNGNNNTYIGAETVPSAADVSNETVVGYGATGLGANSLTLGNSSVTVVGVSADNTTDLGSSSKEFKDLYIDGTANLDAVDIDDGAIDGTAIGATSASTGAFTTVTASTSVDVTGSAGLILENDETITNSNDGTVAINGEVSLGTGSSTGILKSNGNFDLLLKTGNATTGSITITDGANGDITLAPNGTGQVVASSATFTTVTASTSVDLTGSAGLILENDETITNSNDGEVAINGEVSLGTGSSTGILKSNGNFDLLLKTGNATTGSITITDGANGDITLAPNGTGQVVINNDMSFNGDTYTFESTNSTDPLVVMKNTTNDANSSRLRMVKDKGAAGAANDVAGIIEFYADDANQDQTKFSEIKSQAKVVTNGQEGGKLTMSVAEHDGTLTAGLVIEDGDADGEIDVTLGSGTSSITTVSGNLSGSGSISGFDANLNDQTNTTYTLVAGDNGKVVTLDNGSAITVTIDTGLGDGFNCLLVQKGSGQVTISAGTGVTVVNRSSETKTAGQYATVSVINIGSEQYILSGDTGS
ncbi:MAG: beta strand repeat-containing protein [Cytophagales bacterium]